MRAVLLLLLLLTGSTLGGAFAQAPAPSATAAAGLFGGFQSNGTAEEGSFVFFKANATTGRMILYSLGGAQKAVVFDEVVPTPFTPGPGESKQGPVWRLAGGNLLVSALDAPRATLTYKAGAEGASVRFDPAQGVSLSPSGERGILNVTLGNQSAWLVVSRGNLTVEGEAAHAQLDPRGRVTFVAAPRAGLWSHAANEVVRSLARGQLGGEIVVSTVEGNLTSAPVPVDTLLAATRANATAVDFRLSSNSSRGKAYALHLDTSALNLTNRTLQVVVDGQNATPANVSLALTPGDAPRFSAVGSSRGTTVFLALPAFSTRNVTVQAVETAAPPPAPAPPAQDDDATPPPAEDAQAPDTPPAQPAPAEGAETPAPGAWAVVAVTAAAAVAGRRSRAK